MTSFRASVPLLALALTVAACDSSDPLDPPMIDGQLQVEGGRGTAADLVLNLDADAGVQSLTVAVDGGAAEAITVADGATQVTYSFDIPADATVGTAYSLAFTVTDDEGQTDTATGTVTVGRLIDTPDDYEFTRDGSTTVAYNGQINRLNMVAEMKDYLKRADRGEVISEQVLLDMFENAGGNGGGNFSFTASQQLKNKTFAPDLDGGLYEDFFARAAAASVAGNAGTDAADGVAGLITRENSGNTILVDENGREFVQFVEKGLMGSVFYNQIFNTYLTDNRIGPNVENTALRDGENYTDMEHHWDEAFGYFGAPVDFASNWPTERRSEARFWANYSNVSDPELGLNTRIMDAFTAGRAAVVNNDRAEITSNTDELYTVLELTTAATAVHYINDTLGHLDEGKTGEAFHTLSEAWAFTRALLFSPRRQITPAQIDEILDTDFGADGNFWNVTVAGLNKAKSTLVQIYPELAPVQDDL